MTIAFREGLKLQPNVIDQFVEGTQGDIRQILNLLSTYRLSRTQLAFDESKKVYLPKFRMMPDFQCQGCREIHHPETVGYSWTFSQWTNVSCHLENHVERED